MRFRPASLKSALAAVAAAGTVLLVTAYLRPPKRWVPVGASAGNKAEKQPRPECRSPLLPSRLLTAATIRATGLTMPMARLTIPTDPRTITAARITGRTTAPITVAIRIYPYYGRALSTAADSGSTDRASASGSAGNG